MPDSLTPLHLAVALDGAGWHPAAWRESDARPAELFDAGYWADLVAEAERGSLDFVTIEDSLTVQSDDPVDPDDRIDRVRGRLDAVLIAARIAPRTREHVLDSFFGFLEAVGIRDRTLRWDFPLTPDALEYARTLIPDTRPTLVISPCSSHSRRNWRAEAYAAVADHAVRRHGMSVILAGGRTAIERDVGAAIEQAAQESTRRTQGHRADQRPDQFLEGEIVEFLAPEQRGQRGRYLRQDFALGIEQEQPLRAAFEDGLGQPVACVDQLLLFALVTFDGNEHGRTECQRPA